MHKFPSINQFREVKRNVEFAMQYRGLDAEQQPIMDRDAALPVIRYGGTVKIHGTNAALRFEDGQLFCQSRENDITPEKDNAGFARWASQLAPEVSEAIISAYGPNVIIFGEWAGKGVQSGVAVSQLPKFFTIFAVQETPMPPNEKWRDLADLPDLSLFGIFTIAQFGTEYADVDFQNLDASLARLNEVSLTVEAECPVGKFFGVSGVGEGRVWRPLDDPWNHSRYVFKIKGEKHANASAPKLASADPEKVASVQAFVDKHVHEGRLEQGYKWLAEVGHPQNEKSTGHFVKWIVGDVLKEEGDELKFNGLSEKDVNAAMSNKARKWFFGKFNQ